MIRGVLRRLFDTLLFIEPLFDEETLVIELALDMMRIDFPSPNELFARNRVEKEAAKAAKAVKADRSSIPLPLSIIESSPKPSNVSEQPLVEKKRGKRNNRKRL